MQKQDVFHSLVAVLIVLILWANGIIRANAGNEKHVYTARIRCGDVLTEDSAAHIRLVRYGDGEFVYRCTHKGY